MYSRLNRGRLGPMVSTDGGEHVMSWSFRTQTPGERLMSDGGGCGISGVNIKPQSRKDARKGCTAPDTHANGADARRDDDGTDASTASTSGALADGPVRGKGSGRGISSRGDASRDGGARGSGGRTSPGYERLTKSTLANRTHGAAALDQFNDGLTTAVGQFTEKHVSFVCDADEAEQHSLMQAWTRLEGHDMRSEADIAKASGCAVSKPSAYPRVGGDHHGGSSLMAEPLAGSRPGTAMGPTANAAKGSPKMAVDSAFPPAPSSLYSSFVGCPYSLHGIDPDAISWERLGGSLVLPHARLCIVPGHLQDQYFLSAMAMVACKPTKPLYDIVVSDEMAHLGLHTFRFFKNAEWVNVTVDNLVPCAPAGSPAAAAAAAASISVPPSPSSSRPNADGAGGARDVVPLFTTSGNGGEMWPALLEKAYAKLHHSYSAIEHGAVPEAFVDLTGGYCTTLTWTDAKKHDVNALNRLWSDLRERVILQADRCVVAASTTDKEVCEHRPCELLSRSGNADLQRGADGDASRASFTASAPAGGILPGLCYIVIDLKEVSNGLRLVRLFCPWKGGAWTGSWSDGSAEWSQPEYSSLQAELGYAFKDDGSFYMAFTDFVDVFRVAYEGQIPPASWHEVLISRPWLGDVAGGPPPPPQSAQAKQHGLGITDETDARGPDSAMGLDENGVAGSNGAFDDSLVDSSLLEDEQRRLAAVVRSSRSSTASATAGTWSNNPQFLIRPKKQGPVGLSGGARGDMGHMTGDQGGASASTATAADLAMGFSRFKPQDIVIRLSQQDSRISSQTYVPLDRRPAVGMMLLASNPQQYASAGMGVRLWKYRKKDVLSIASLSTHREVTIVSQISAEQPSVVVPYMNAPGAEGPFVLRIFSPCPIEVDMLPSPLCLTMEGEWETGRAGGMIQHATWGSNPQYLLRVFRKTHVTMILDRTSDAGVDEDVAFRQDAAPGGPSDDEGQDKRMSILKARADEATIGIVLSSSDKCVDGYARRCSVDPEREQHCIVSSFDGRDSAIMYEQLEAGYYTVTPCCSLPGVTGAFSISFFSSEELELKEFPPTRSKVTRGAWTRAVTAAACTINGDSDTAAGAAPAGVGSANNGNHQPGPASMTAGGCDLHPTWHLNPRYVIDVEERCRVRIGLRRVKSAAGHHSAPPTLKDMIGFYVLRVKRSSIKDGDLKLRLKSVICETSFVPMDDVDMEVDLRPDGGSFVHVVIPCTYAPAREGTFELTVTALVKFTLKELVKKLPAKK